MASRTKTFSAKQITTGALLTALALIFSYIEVLIPFNLGLPGIKLGLANIVVVVALYKLGPKYGFIINVARICLVALLFGNMFSAVYALSGGILSFVCMMLLMKTKLFSVVGVSMAGGVFHNAGQMLAAIVLVSSAKAIYYFPVLLIAGMVTGIVIGMIATLIMRALK